MRPLGTLLVAALLVAGCTATPSIVHPEPTPADGAPPLSLDTVDVSETRGAIEGTAVDASLLPVANASIVLRAGVEDGADVAKVLTRPDGRFVFSLLEPGSYRVTAVATGYENATRLVLVKAGESTAVKLSLGDRPSDEPYADLKIQNGLLNFGWSAVVASGVLLPYQTEPVFGPFKIELVFMIPAGHRAIVSETEWAQRNQVMRNWFFHEENHKAGPVGGDWMGDAVGTPTLRKEFRPDQIPSSFSNPSITVAPKPVPPSTQNFTLVALTYFDGSYQKEVNSTLGPSVCSHTIVGYCTGAGVAFQMRYAQYVTSFVNEAPDPLSSYSAVPDH